MATKGTGTAEEGDHFPWLWSGGAAAGLMYFTPHN